MARPASSLHFTFWLLVVLNTCVLIWGILNRIGFTLKDDEQVYTYIGNDYPLEYPIGHLEPVAMTLYDSVRFSLDPGDTLANLSEWATLGENPKGFGRTRLGPDHRVFLPTFYHQLHCVRRAQIAFVDQSNQASNARHFAHCLNYLRQTLLCTAADMLERGDFMSRDWGKDRMGDSLVCYDWKKVHDVLDTEYENWLEWKRQWA